MKIKEKAQEIAAITEQKNQAYGNSYHRCHVMLTELWPDGVPVSDYKKLLAVARIIDKLFRIANDENAFSEDPWRDIAGYAILMSSNEDK